MITLKQYINEAKNLHLEHAEDLVFDLGVEGTRTAINFLRDVRDMLTVGEASNRGTITVKWDGAPAVFAGINPENGRFFVAKKGLFNKTPKLYYSHEDIMSDTTGDLASKLKIAFTECNKLGIKSGVYQGDILFTKQDLFTQDIDGEKYVCFHPNTIVYAVPYGSGLAKRIMAANVGIVWHTTYTGKTISGLSASFGKSITNNFKKTNTSWMQDATFTDATGVSMFSARERTEFDAKLSAIGKMFQQMPSQLVNAIHKDPDLLALVHVYNNSKVRAGEMVADVNSHVDGLYQFIHDRFAKEEGTKKTVEGKTKVAEKRRKILNFFLLHPKAEIAKVFALSRMIADAKLMLVRKLNSASNVATFLKTRDGFRVTAPEGYVAIRGDGAVKLVDRMQFSMANFSPEIVKGWER